MSAIKCPDARRRMKRRLFDAQGGACALCMGPMAYDMPENHPDACSFDHVTPKSKGGKNPNNLILAHVRCNQERSNRNPTKHEKTALMVVQAMMRRGRK